MIKSGEFDLRGCEIMLTQFFASASMTSASFSKNGIRFSSACIRGVEKTEYVEIQIHPFTRSIAVIPCSEHNKLRVRWAILHADCISARAISAKAYLETIFELFNWDVSMRYRLRGEIIKDNSHAIALFDARRPEIFTSRYDISMPWANGFGDGYYVYKASRKSAIAYAENFSEYDIEPELHPTTQDEADNSIRSLIERFRMEWEASCNDSTDILDL